MAEKPRQRVERVPGARRARLTPVEGSDPEPETASRETDAVAPVATGDNGPNDDRLRRDVPPHY